jgi:hypothetical protein
MYLATSRTPASMEFQFALPVLLCALLCSPIATKPIADDCKEQWYTQRLDHFHWKRADDGEQPTFQQRYYVCDAHWQRTDPKGPIFFYGMHVSAITSI